jgi:hypothetical protein
VLCQLSYTPLKPAGFGDWQIAFGVKLTLCLKTGSLGRCCCQHIQGYQKFSFSSKAFCESPMINLIGERRLLEDLGHNA